MPVTLVHGTPIALGHWANHRAVLFSMAMHASKDHGLVFPVALPREEDTPGLLQQMFALVDEGGLGVWPVDAGRDGAVPITVLSPQRRTRPAT